jgi:hypothetical protein
VVENDDAGADEFRAPSEYPTYLNLYGDGPERKSVIQRFGNPALLLLGDVAKVDSTMAIRNSVIVVPIGALADELKCFAWSNVLTRIEAAVDPAGRLSP